MRVIYKIFRRKVNVESNELHWFMERIVFIKKPEIVDELNDAWSSAELYDVKFFGDKKEAIEYMENNGGLA